MTGRDLIADPSERLDILSDMVSSGKLDKMATWICPVCGTNVHRELLRAADEGAFPEDYDYTLYESNPNFLLKIIEHICGHMTRQTEGGI